MQLDNVLLINLLIPTSMAAPLTLSATNIQQQTAANARSRPKIEALCHCFPVMNCHFTSLHYSSGRDTHTERERERERERAFSLAAFLGVTASQRKEAQCGCVPISSSDDIPYKFPPILAPSLDPKFTLQLSMYLLL
jgi:hypothetical protein